VVEFGVLVVPTNRLVEVLMSLREVFLILIDVAQVEVDVRVFWVVLDRLFVVNLGQFEVASVVVRHAQVLLVI